jgi:nucleotide-binding universal stress UspA family protein
MTGVFRILVPIDDSPAALRAVRHVIELAGHGLAAEVHLLNVQAQVRGAAATLIAQRELNDYHREEGMKTLAGANDLVEQAGLPVHLHVGVGTAGEIALAFARRLGCQQIVMGTRGLGGVAGMVMGSVARHVVAESDVPVTLVRVPDG